MRVLIHGGKGEDATRIAAALRSGGIDIAAPDAPFDLLLTLGDSSSQYLHCGDITIDRVRRHVARAGVRATLTPVEFDLLCHLAIATQPASRAQLIRDVWGYTFDPGTNSVAVHISRIRAKLGRDAILSGPRGYWLARG